MRAAAPLLLAALAACAPLPDATPRQLTAQGIRPGAGAAHDFAPTPGAPLRYEVRTAMREAPNAMEVSFAARNGGFTRTETVRIPESSAVEAGIIASMVRQREGRAAEIDGTDIVLRARAELDARGRTVRIDRGGPVVRWDPHDCRATPGECRTARTGPDGRTDHLVVTTAETAGVWREQIRRDPSRDPQGRTTLLQESLYSLDAAGLLVDMNRLDHERDLGGYQEIRRAHGG